MWKDFGRLRCNRPVGGALFEVWYLKSLKATPDDKASNKAFVTGLSRERDRIFKNPRGRAELETPRDRPLRPQ